MGNVAEGVKVLSLFDGISCARVAFDRAGIKVKEYLASEVDSFAIEVSKKNYPDIVHIGDVKTVSGFNEVDFLIGGSPCQDLSVAKQNRQGLSGERSVLFWEYLRVLKETRPKYFIFENVASMHEEDKHTITLALGVSPILLDAALVSAQSRKRYFWTNIKTCVPEDRGILLKDVLLEKVEGVLYREEYIKSVPKKVDNTRPIRIGSIGKGRQGERVYSVDGKSIGLCGSCDGKCGWYNVGGGIRTLHSIEKEILQGLPKDYTSGQSKTRRQKLLGNAFNVDIVAHILKGVCTENGIQ